MKRFLIVSLVLLLAGCVANGFYEGIALETPEHVLSENKKIFVGMPYVVSLIGSSAKYNDEWRVTAAHNRWLISKEEAYFHPFCDFALFRDSSGESKKSKLGYILENEEVYHVGYPLGLSISSHKGTYIGEILNPVDNCVYSASDATLISGMSGGGAYNKYGDLVGVNIGIMHGNIKWPDGRVGFSPSIFISINAVKIFIEEVIGSEVVLEPRNS